MNLFERYTDWNFDEDKYSVAKSDFYVVRKSNVLTWDSLLPPEAPDGYSYGVVYSGRFEIVYERYRYLVDAQKHHRWFGNCPLISVCLVRNKYGHKTTFKQPPGIGVWSQ